jgi:acetyl-CoA acetyltransferase
VLSREVAVAGVGYAPIARAGTFDILRLTRTASLAALDDAGLAPKDVDGIIQYSFGSGDSPAASTVQRLLGVPDLAVYNDISGSGPSGLASALDATMAVASGACETALVYRTMTRQAGHTGDARTGPATASGSMQFLSPYGYGGGIMMAIAMYMRRRMATFGDGEADFGRIAVNARRWSKDNERAVLRDEITIDDYLASRMVCDPLHLYDCDYPVSGACAAVITTAERARDLAKTPVLIESISYGTGNDPDWLFTGDMIAEGIDGAARRVWAGTSLTPDDVDLALLYDGFSALTVAWVEAFGFCGTGEFSDWVDEGRTIGPGGSLPVNTHGGQLTEGRLHGLAFLTEAVLQLRGECGVRQVPDAKVAAIGNAGGPQCGAMVVRLDD